MKKNTKNAAATQAAAVRNEKAQANAAAAVRNEQAAADMMQFAAHCMKQAEELFLNAQSFEDVEMAKINMTNGKQAAADAATDAAADATQAKAKGRHTNAAAVLCMGALYMHTHEHETKSVITRGRRGRKSFAKREPDVDENGRNALSAPVAKTELPQKVKCLRGTRNNDGN